MEYKNKNSLDNLYLVIASYKLVNSSFHLKILNFFFFFLIKIFEMFQKGKITK